jgi:heme/copper-type cytochrome/quinol oxidase subunit 3
VIAGLIIMAFVARTAVRNQELQRVEYVGLYWHFVDIVWIFLFPLLYIAK